mgnify:CR=1 FL=1
MIRPLLIAAAIVAAAPAIAQTAPAPAERTAAAAEARAKLAAGEFKIAEERSPWAVSCVTDMRTNVRGCSLFTRMLLEDDIILAAIAVNFSYVDGAPVLRLASDAGFPRVAVVQVDTLAPLETRTCTSNSCTFTGDAARVLAEELRTGVVLYAR